MNISELLTQAEPTDPEDSPPGMSHTLNASRSRLPTQVRSFFCARQTLRRFADRLLPGYGNDAHVGGVAVLLSLFGELAARH